MTANTPEEHTLVIRLGSPDGGEPLPGWMLGAIAPGTILVARVEAAAEGAAVLAALRWAPPSPMAELLITGAADAAAQAAAQYEPQNEGGPRLLPGQPGRHREQ